MVHGHKTSLLFRVLKKGELGHPQEFELVFLKKVLLPCQLQTEIAQNIPDHFILISRKEEKVSRLSVHGFYQAVKFFFCHEFSKGRLESAVFLHCQIGKSFGPEILGKIHQGINLFPWHSPLAFGVDSSDAAALGQSEKTAADVARQLKERYDREKRGLQIIALDDSYQMCTRVEYYENLIRVASAPKKHALTDVVLETLSIIAYKQPVTKLEIEKIRGVKSDHAVNRLVEYNLVQEVGRLDAPGRPALFATTEEFLRRFGIGSTDHLPAMDPVRAEELRSQVEEELKVTMEETEQETGGES